MSGTEETVTGEPEADTKAVDWTETLGSVYDKVTAAEPAAEDAPAEDAGRSRDERGRFAPEAKKDEAQDATQAATEPAEPAIEPPASWAAEKRAAWPTLPVEVRQYIAEREAEAHRQISQQGEQVAKFRELAEVLQPYEQAFALSGINTAAAVRQLLETQAMLYRDPVNGLKWVAQQFGVTPDQLAQIVPEQAPMDPQVQALRQELDQIKQFAAQQQAQQQAALRGSLESEISSFAKDRPHFDAVREHMGRLIHSGTAQDLADAYDQAVWANPTTRALLIEEQKRAAAAEVEKARKAESAKRAASVNVRGSPDQVAAAPRDWRESLGQIYDQVTTAA